MAWNALTTAGSLSARIPYPKQPNGLGVKSAGEKPRKATVGLTAAETLAQAENWQ